MKRIVSDTGPVMHLLEADLIWILNKGGSVYIPPIVRVELETSGYGNLPDWIIIEQLSPSENKESEHLLLSGMLDIGEAGAIILAKRMRPDWFLTDDAGARIFAKSLGMEVHGSLGMLLWAAAVGHMHYAEAQEALEKLSKTSLWISRKILLESKAALSKMFQS